MRILEATQNYSMELKNTSNSALQTDDYNGQQNNKATNTYNKVSLVQQYCTVKKQEIHPKLNKWNVFIWYLYLLYLTSSRYPCFKWIRISRIMWFDVL